MVDADAGTQGKLEYHQLDISSQESVKDFASWLQQQHGKLDILVNNAGEQVHLCDNHVTTANVSSSCTGRFLGMWRVVLRS
jgi:NAD(P)-dependent dehydrogenase (short-subunit alcohol dehydrogenase family)